DVRDFVQVAERRHHAFPDQLGRDLGSAHPKELGFDVLHRLVDRLGRDGALETGHADGAGELLSIVLLAPAVLLDDHEAQPLGTLVRRETLPAAEALAPPAHRLVQLARVDHLRARLVTTADQTAHVRAPSQLSSTTYCGRTLSLPLGLVQSSDKST